MARGYRSMVLWATIAAVVVLGAAALVTAGLILHGLASPPATEQVGGHTYYRTTVTVPGNATQDRPMQVVFHNATFVLWWPYIPPGSVSSGVYGVSLLITEPSGTVDQANTDCAACGQFTESWFSADSEVGIQYEASPGALGTVTLLVEA